MDSIHSLMNSFGAETRWAIEIFLVIFATLLLSFFAGRSLGKLDIKLQRTKNAWDNALVEALQKPVRALIWVLGTTFALEIVYKETEANILSVVYPARDVLVIACIGWFILRFIKMVEENIIEQHIAEGKDIDKSTADAVTQLLRIAVVITIGLIILQTLGFSISGVLAFGGVGGVAIGFAAKDLLANFFGALMIYLDRPFAVGDWIRSPDKQIEGTVERIGWRQTCIRTFDKRPLYVPNSVFSTISVENPSRMTNRRIYETIGVRYDDVDKVADIVKDVETMLRSHDDIDSSLTLIVNLNAYAASSVDFFIYTFTHTTDWVTYHGIKQDVLLKISDIITGYGAEIAYPTSTLHIPEGVQMISETSEK